MVPSIQSGEVWFNPIRINATPGSRSKKVSLTRDGVLMAATEVARVPGAAQASWRDGRRCRAGPGAPRPAAGSAPSRTPADMPPRTDVRTARAPPANHVRVPPGSARACLPGDGARCTRGGWPRRRAPPARRPRELDTQHVGDVDLDSDAGAVTVVRWSVGTPLVRAHVAVRAAVHAAHVRIERPLEPHALDAIERRPARLFAILRTHRR